MKTYLFKRFLLIIPTFLGITLLTFLSSNWHPVILSRQKFRHPKESKHKVSQKKFSISSKNSMVWIHRFQAGTNISFIKRMQLYWESKMLKRETGFENSRSGPEKIGFNTHNGSNEFVHSISEIVSKIIGQSSLKLKKLFQLLSL